MFWAETPAYPVPPTSNWPDEEVMKMVLPEERARQNIDAMLQAAGWDVQDRQAVNLGVATGIAVREFSLSTGFADYLLYVNRKALGAIEAKPEGIPLSGVEPQSAKYSTGLDDKIP